MGSPLRIRETATGVAVLRTTRRGRGAASRDFATRGSVACSSSELPLRPRDRRGAQPVRQTCLLAARTALARLPPLRWLVDTRGERRGRRRRARCGEKGRASQCGGGFNLVFAAATVLMPCSRSAARGRLAGAPQRSLRLGRQGLGRTAIAYSRGCRADMPFDELRVCHLLGDREDERASVAHARRAQPDTESAHHEPSTASRFELGLCNRFRAHNNTSPAEFLPKRENRRSPVCSPSPRRASASAMHKSRAPRLDTPSTCTVHSPTSPKPSRLQPTGGRLARPGSACTPSGSCLLFARLRSAPGPCTPSCTPSCLRLLFARYARRRRYPLSLGNLAASSNGVDLPPEGARDGLPHAHVQ